MSSTVFDAMLSTFHALSYLVLDTTFKTIPQQQLHPELGKGPELTFPRRRSADGQQLHEKTLNITNHQGNPNPNQEMPLSLTGAVTTKC